MIETVHLPPGECFFGTSRHRVHTLLGSCVAVTVWAPGLQIGGVCHVMLPWGGRSRPPQGSRDARYADSAMQQVRHWMKVHGLAPAQVEIKLFGGGATLPRHSEQPGVGMRNIQAIEALLVTQGFGVTVSDLGGPGYRVLRFDLATGHVWVRRGACEGAMS